jgi:uncharacterized protein YndB with AHSA1/START domain
MARGGPIDEPIRLALTVPVPVESAFTTFVDLTRWWPREYTWAADVLEDIGIEPRQGGHCFERGPYGFTCHWGRVLAWEPPTRLVFIWQIAPDRVPEPNPAKASEVEVRFQPSGPPAPVSSSSTAPWPGTARAATPTARVWPPRKAGPTSSTATPPPCADPYGGNRSNEPPVVSSTAARERGGTADAPGLGPGGATRGGSNPPARTPF